MKVCIMQPPYSVQYDERDAMFQWELDALDRCDASMDIIVLPEAGDVPTLASTREEFIDSYRRYNGRFLDKVCETAKRCDAVVFANATFVTEKGERNTTYAVNRQGEIVGHYFKQHLTMSECFGRKLDCGYTFDFSEPYVLTIDGVRYAFLTCYDFYFYEMFPNLARQNIDVIVGCSHQRSDRLDAIETITKFCAYHTNAYVLRSSVSLDENSETGGGSMVVAPDGKILVNLGHKVGVATVDIDPHAKYYKPAGFGNPPSAHYEYIDIGRRPWKYRPAGSFIVPHDAWMQYPRVCAHRGYHASLPENGMAAFGAAVGLDADEIELDVWCLPDGKLACVHDKYIETGRGQAAVCGMTWEEVRAVPGGEDIVLLETVLRKFSCHVVMNIHLKTMDNVTPWPEEGLRQVLGLLKKYDCEKHCYLTSGNDFVLRQLRALDKDVILCCAAGDRPDAVVERAAEFGCQKVQFKYGHIDAERIRKAHEAGIACNLYKADDPAEVVRWLDAGLDTVLTDNLPEVQKTVRQWKETHPQETGMGCARCRT